MTETDFRAIANSARSRTAHHEAGHAVAAVYRGGRVTHLHLGEADWSSGDTTTDKPAEVHHQSTTAAQPFITFAGPWAEAMWTVDNDADMDDLHEALHCAWDNNADGDTSTYEDRVATFEALASELGFSPLHRSWEFAWVQELDPLWPVIRAAAEMLIDGQSVTHETISLLLRDFGDDA